MEQYVCINTTSSHILLGDLPAAVELAAEFSTLSCRRQTAKKPPKFHTKCQLLQKFTKSYQIVFTKRDTNIHLVPFGENVIKTVSVSVCCLSICTYTSRHCRSSEICMWTFARIVRANSSRQCETAL